MSVKDDSQLDELRDLRKTALALRFALQELYGLLSDGVDTSWYSTDEAQAARDILNATVENDWEED